VVACQGVRREGPADGLEVRFRKTRKTEVEAQIELGKLLALARAGRNPDSCATVTGLLDAYVPVAGWDVSTEETNLGYIRRTINPALGTKEVRKLPATSSHRGGHWFDPSISHQQERARPTIASRHVTAIKSTAVRVWPSSIHVTSRAVSAVCSAQ
jgi:hypothetical protein